MKKSSRSRSRRFPPWLIPAGLVLFVGLLLAVRPNDLTPRVQRAESTVAALLKAEGVRPSRDLISESAEWRQAGRSRWNFLEQRYRISASFPWDFFRKELDRDLKKQKLMLVKFQRQTSPAPKLQYDISAPGLPRGALLMRLILEPKTTAPIPPVSAPSFPKGKGKIAIVLDDWGYTMRQVPAVNSIEQPLTLSVLPGLPYSTQVAVAARAHGHQVMLHMPMEAMDPNEPRETDTLLTGMSRREVLDRLNRSLLTVPGAAGMNNHQGSKATADSVLMEVVLQEVKRRGLFFMDSFTGRSVGPVLARRMGVRFARRDVFLDNTAAPAAIRKQLAELARLASKNGKAIAIGHDRPATIQVLQEALPALEQAGYTLVPLSDLTENSS